MLNYLLLVFGIGLAIAGIGVLWAVCGAATFLIMEKLELGSQEFRNSIKGDICIAGPFILVFAPFLYFCSLVCRLFNAFLKLWATFGKGTP